MRIGAVNSISRFNRIEYSTSQKKVEGFKNLDVFETSNDEFKGTAQSVAFKGKKEIIGGLLGSTVGTLAGVGLGAILTIGTGGLAAPLLAGMAGCALGSAGGSELGERLEDPKDKKDYYERDNEIDHCYP